MRHDWNKALTGLRAKQKQVGKLVMCHIELLDRYKKVHVPMNSDAAYVVGELGIVQKCLNSNFCYQKLMFSELIQWLDVS